MAAAEHDEALEEVAADPHGDRLQSVFDRAMQRFDVTVPPQQEMRALALQARRFVSIPGAMWEGPWGDQFENSIKVEVNKVAKGLKKLVRDYRDNRIVPDFRPAGGDSDQETADTLDGMHRADSYHFKAQQARDNAYEEAAAGGFGAYRLTNEWADPLDKDSDEQRINPAMTIVDADQRVFFDGNSKLYDKSDAGFCFVLTAMMRGEFEEQHPDSPVSWPEGLFKTFYDWFAPEIIVKCEYYEVEDKDEKLLILSHALTGDEQRWWSSDIEADDLAELEQMGWQVRSRRQKRRRVHKYTMSGAEVLKDNSFIAGACIPVVPVYGERFYIDNQERFRGYVQLKMDAQRLYNGRVSKLAETDALAPREIPIFAAEQMPPALAEQWANQNIERHAYALVNPLIDPASGAIVSAGAVGKVEPPQLAPVTAMLLQIASNDLDDDQQEPDQAVSNVSAEAMDIAGTRVDAKSDINLDNMRQSVQREGEIYLSMARDIYYEPRRTVETMTEDGDDGEAQLHTPMTDKAGRHRIVNDFASGRYKVIADVTEATATRRDKAVKSNLYVADIAAKAGDQELAQVALLIAVMNQDGEGSEVTNRYARKRLVAMEVVEPNEEEKAEMEQAAQNQQPDPTAALLTASAKEKEASAALKTAQVQKTAAETIEAQASAGLKAAQADAVGGPEAEPDVPDGLEQASNVVDIHKKLAETRHIEAQTAHLPQEMAIEAHRAETQRLQAENRPKIRKGSEL